MHTTKLAVAEPTSSRELPRRSRFSYVFFDIAQIPLGWSRHVLTRHVRRVEPMHFGSVELVEQRGATRSSRRARLVERVVSCRDVTSQVEFGLMGVRRNSTVVLVF